MKSRIWIIVISCLVIIGLMITGTAIYVKKIKDKESAVTIDQPKETPVPTVTITPAAIPETEAAPIENVPVPEIEPVENVPIPEVEQTQKFEICQVVHCNEFITLRTAPSTSGAEICKIPLGADVYYLENAENGFVKIMYNDQVGYSLASYLNFSQSEGAIFMQVVDCETSITLRKIPSTKAEEFCQIPLGEKVIFRESAENGFYMVSYNGYTGYALASYLTEW